MEGKNKEVIEQINEWFFSDRNFEIGFELLKKVHKNKILIKYLDRKGECKESKEHLEWELFKHSEHTDERIIYRLEEYLQSRKEVKKKVENEIKDKAKEETSPFLLFEDDYIEPKDEREKNFLSNIIEFQRNCNNEIAIFQKEMDKLGDKKSPEINKRRKDFLLEIYLNTQIVYFLHNQKLRWKKTGDKPKESILDWQPQFIEEIDIDKQILIEEIGVVDLQKQLQKIRSWLNKLVKLLEISDNIELKNIKKKIIENELLKQEILDNINIIKTKYYDFIK